MKIYVILLAVCSIILPVLSEIRYNRPRGPPPPPRGPFPPQFAKGKWPMPYRIPNRNFVRPIPVQMASYKQPVIVPRPPRVPTPIIFPSAIWKSPANGYRPPIDKPFLSSPPVNKPYEFINNEPALGISSSTLTNTIKQVGEKGPIHTIPAPNLSPADKPAIIHEEFPHKSSYQSLKDNELSLNSIQGFTNQIPQALPLIQQTPLHQAPLQQSTIVQQQPAIALHQYQVTEYHGEQQLPNERPAQFSSQQTYFAPDPDPKLNINQFNSELSSLANNANLFPQGALLGTPQQSILASQQNIVSPPGLLSHQELLQILNSIPQQHLVDSYGTPLVQQPQLQQHFMQQAHQTTQQVPQHLFQPDFLNQIQDVPESVKNNFKPQFHTFNYEEQSRHKPVPTDFAQSRVTGDYTLEPETSENNPSVAIQNPNDALAQSHYVQQYFSSTADSPVVNENIVETEGHNEKDVTRIFSQLTSTGEVTPNMFYSSLPNREAAETLASLQAAGNVNNIIKTIQQNDQPTNNNQMRIYVPDEEESEEMETSGEIDDNSEQPTQGIKIFETTYVKTPENHKSKDSVEYSDFSVEQDKQNNKSPSEELYTVKNTVSFGSRIKSKNET